MKKIKEVFLYSWCEDFVQSESPARTHDKSTKSNALFPAVHVNVLQSTGAPDERMQQIRLGCTHGAACSLRRRANEWPPFSDYPSCIALSLSLSRPDAYSRPLIWPTTARQTPPRAPFSWRASRAMCRGGRPGT